MTHEDQGHYGEKHPGAKLDPEIAKKLKEKISDGRISCGDAHAVAAALKVSPRTVGIAIDLLEAHIVDCELGLFGSGVQQPEGELSAEAEKLLRQAVEAALVQGRLSCAAAWNIAKKLGIAKVAVKLACDRMSIKINRCQLGTFK
jgi:hypothetical protein